MAINEFEFNDRDGPAAGQVAPEIESELRLPTEQHGSVVPSEPDYPADPPLAAFVPDSLTETTRKSGLAWSAGIVFFSSIAFMLVLGWFADLLLGSSPWGVVAGIVLGSLVGFMQFFRITSSIFPKPVTKTPPRTLIAEEKNDPYA